MKKAKSLNVEYAAIGSMTGQALRYRRVETRFGPAYIGAIKERLCFFGFGDNLDLEINRLVIKWGLGDVQPEKRLFVVTDIFIQPPPMTLIGTVFQHEVWRRLLLIRAGETKSYGDLANLLGSAPRAIGGSVGANPVAYFVPCHRIIRHDGTLGGYRWGLDVKQKILKSEVVG